MSKGFVIMAQNSETVDYVSCAETLRASIEQYMPHIPVTIITEGKADFSTDPEVYNQSPYDYTIKLEADMLMTKNVDYWFDVFKDRDIVVCNTIRDYKGNISNVKAYREFTQVNKLPDVYNAMTYFKKSKFSEDFFNLTKEIFQNWEEYKKILICNTDEQASTDWVYSTACHIMGIDNTTMPYTDFSFVHMKQLINNLATEDWTSELVYEFNPLRIQTIPQQYPFHYYVKTFGDKYYG